MCHCLLQYEGVEMLECHRVELLGNNSRFFYSFSIIYIYIYIYISVDSSCFGICPLISTEQSTIAHTFEIAK